MITTGRIVNFWGEGHGRRPSASPQSAKWLRPSTSPLWGQHSRHTAGTPGKSESLLDYTGTNLLKVAINRTLWALHATALTSHSHDITPQGVDSMWTPMYESNQRSKNHNKSL